VFSNVHAVLNKNWKESHHDRLCEILTSVEHECQVEISFVKGKYQFEGSLSAIFKVSEMLGREADRSRNVSSETNADDVLSRSSAEQRGELSTSDDAKQMEQTESTLLDTSADPGVHGPKSLTSSHSTSDAPLSVGCDSISSVKAGTGEEQCQAGGSKWWNQQEITTPQTDLLSSTPCTAEKKNCQTSDNGAVADDGAKNAMYQPASKQFQQPTTLSTAETESVETANQEHSDANASHPTTDSVLICESSARCSRAAAADSSKARKKLIYIRERDSAELSTNC